MFSAWFTRTNASTKNYSILCKRQQASGPVRRFHTSDGRNDKQEVFTGEIRKNPVGIQRLSEELYKQLFPDVSKAKGSRKDAIDLRLVKLAHKYLKSNDLYGKQCSENPPITFKMPKLQGKNIEEHFYRLGTASCSRYLALVEKFLRLGNDPPGMPKGRWQFRSGWTRYCAGKEPETVPYPLEDELVFDVEVMYKKSHYPILATCMSPTAWYGWCSPYLTGESGLIDGHLIPLGVDKHDKIVVGHNVSYDRARVKEEYSLKATRAFYIDTMSLHVAVSGMCSRQRGKWIQYRKKMDEKTEQEGNLEKIRDGARTGGLKKLLANPILDDEVMDPAKDGSEESNIRLSDDPWLKMSSLNSLKHVARFHCGIHMDKKIRDDFATANVEDIRGRFQQLMDYCAGDVDATYRVFNKVFPMFRKIVPHNVSFAALRIIDQSFLPVNRTWNEYIRTAEGLYQESFRKIEDKLKQLCDDVVSLKDKAAQKPWEKDPWLSQLDWTIVAPKFTKSGRPYKRQKLPGYPEWYKKLVTKHKLRITTRTRIAPLLLRLSWEGNPVFWTKTKGWCFWVDRAKEDEFKAKNYLQIKPECLLDEEPQLEEVLSRILPKKSLFKVPHESGPSARTTSLMSKPFLRYFEQDILSSEFQVAKDALQLAVSNSYWVSSRERIMDQFVVFDDEGVVDITGEGMKDKDKAEDNAQAIGNAQENAQVNIPTTRMKSFVNPKNSNINTVGVIIPQVISMGTITRRAVEKTWLTASNAKKNRLGSELKAMVRAPDGYCFVGADVDSEELWIASLMGDSVFKIHGGTALGWMTLEGNKAMGTDLHSKTAQILGISRGDAKVFNYGRIYGAGVDFATTLLKKFNPSLSDGEAVSTAHRLYSATKGKSGMLDGERVWYGGSESVVFNRLERIAQQDEPKTPALGAGITAALKKRFLNANTFMPSRVNWAIQSSGVDYLHLILTSVEYLCKVYGIQARLCLTVHDEARYITRLEDRYKMAMVMQIANVWTRAMFCHQVGIDDIPQCCAFFSAVDIDRVIRKEVNMDCITPSNGTAIPHGESLDVYQILAKPEVREMLAHPRNIDLSAIDVPQRVDKPLEAMDRQLDDGTRCLYISMQIAKSEAEFAGYKRKYLRNIDFQHSMHFGAALGAKRRPRRRRSHAKAQRKNIVNETTSLVLNPQPVTQPAAPPPLPDNAADGASTAVDMAFRATSLSAQDMREIFAQPLRTARIYQRR